jgi:hypothetical protein
MIFQVNKSFIGYNEDIPMYIHDYFYHIVSIISKILNNNNISINVIVGDCYDSFNNDLKTIKIYINYEHTLVLKGGRDTEGSLEGIIKTNDLDNYLVRIDFNSMNDADIIIEYSIPNIENITTSNLYPEISKKLVYIAPALYDQNWVEKNRQINVLTTFIRTCEPRRAQLLEKLKQQNITHINVNDCFEKKRLEDLYSNTKIIINIHQTDHHHTFEELRVLPALLCGCIVICEDSPLKELVPYHNYLIWVKYDEIVETCIEVQNNYDHYYNQLFGNKDMLFFETNLEKKLLHLHMSSLDDISFKYVLDKNIRTGHHDYIKNYSLLFDNIRDNVKTILEIGIGSVENDQMRGVWDIGYKTGNSLKCWEEYFQNADIYGIDIFDHTNLSNGRINVFAANQEIESDLQSCLEKMKLPLDIIIDDGSHIGEHQKKSFMILEKFLSPKGIYVIEDIQAVNIESFQNLSIFPEDFRSHILNTYNITYFDTRYNNNRYREDDFMIAFIRK